MGLQTTQGYRGKLVDKLTGTILDTFADEDIKISNNILDLFDIGQLPGTFTQQLTLPGTKINNAFFEQYYDISVYEPDLFNTNQVAEAYLDFDGFYLVNGYIQLNKVNVLENKFVDSYEVNLFGIISNFSIDTRTSFLTDLTELNAYNHTASISNITASWQRNLFNGDIVYPMAEYGQNIFYSEIEQRGIDDPEGGLTVQDYKPAIRIKKVWDAIFSQFGYTYTGSFWNEPFLNDVYLVCNNNLRTPVFQPSIETYNQGKVAVASGSIPISLTASTPTNWGFNSKIYDYDNKFTLSGGTTTYETDISTYLTCKADLAFKVTNTGAGSGIPQFKFIFKNTVTNVTSSVQPQFLNNYLNVIRQSRSTTVTEEFNIKDYTFRSPLLPSASYYLNIEYNVSGASNFSVQLNPSFNNSCTFEVVRVNQAADDKIINIPQNMPFGNSGIRVIDFIQSIQKKFNLIIYPDKLNPNQFIVETFNDWYKTGEVKNFNNYINLQNPIEFLPANQLGYKQLKFSDQTDTDYVTTLFRRTNNRTYGESNFYDSGSYYSQGTLNIISDSIASGPLRIIPGSVETGSVLLTQTCNTYELTNPSTSNAAVLSGIECSSGLTISIALSAGQSTTVCVREEPTVVSEDLFEPVRIIRIGDCSPAPANPLTGSLYPVWVPYYIADNAYNPARVLPRIMFYNNNLPASPYYINAKISSSVSDVLLNSYPYFDNYSSGSINGTGSLFPQLNSRSLLYNNEETVLGTTPSGSLISEYWETYLSLLYNPRTRLVNATAVIPLADYFDLELNDIAEFRSNYYHLRAINDYNITTGECSIQMLGPIIPDTISSVLSGSFAPFADPCVFAYSASLYTCTTWEEAPSQWEQANVLWNCGN